MSRICFTFFSSYLYGYAYGYVASPYTRIDMSMCKWCLECVCPDMCIRKHIGVALPCDMCMHTHIGICCFSFSSFGLIRKSSVLVLLCQVIRLLIHIWEGIFFSCSLCIFRHILAWIVFLVAFIFVSKTCETHKSLSKRSNDVRKTLNNENFLNACKWHINWLKKCMQVDITHKILLLKWW